jgi:plasmid stabilization system protein ParE
MNRYLLTEQAHLDLQNIWDYIAEGSIDAADQVAAEFRSAFELLADHSRIGHRRMDVIDRRYRFWRVRRYIVAYFPDTTPLQVIRIVGGEQDFRRLFDQHEI